ncbi:Mrp family chromosome partitioning ATPase [Paraburkholderia sp. UCT70]|uniref:AAA family ATPase n=1 Tax=Paraburkholderia sp. UCT70 TaxID=2991068 RepID=UPI003D22775E
MMKLDELRLDIRLTLTTPPPTLDHVLPGLLAGSVGVVAAPGGTGKSMLLTQIALAIAAGQPVLVGAMTSCPASTPAKVVIFLAEETRAVMHHRLPAASSRGLRGARMVRVSNDWRRHPLYSCCRPTGEWTKTTNIR